MTGSAAGGRVIPPWKSTGFFSESDLRAVQEYYFQTHATNSHRIAQGRNAQGIIKSLVRRKLSKEIGEDFKLYTGQTVGQGGDGEVSRGIRGELNTLLRNVYNHIAPSKPILSPSQEDVTILQHPHGALEVCYAMIWFYTNLVKRHATLVGNRRKVLKSILDEELFKWIWRMTLGYLLSTPAQQGLWKDSFLSAGLPYIPPGRQHAPLPLKLFEIGEFLLGKAIAESHLRFPLCYYFTLYLRAVQEQQVRLAGPVADALYTRIITRAPEAPPDSLLVAIDLLMNMAGNSTESFADVLSNEALTVRKFIPARELEFIWQFDRFSSEERIAATLKEIVPVLTPEELAAKFSVSLMPLMLVLRTVPPGVRTLMLRQLSIPVMVLLRMRIRSSAQDNGARGLEKVIREELLLRMGGMKSAQAGAIERRGSTGVGAIMTGPEAQLPVEMGVLPASVPSGPAQATRAPTAATEGKSNRENKIPAAGASVADISFGHRIVLSWWQEGASIAMRTISARDIAAIAGGERDAFAPWVRLGINTSQILPRGVTGPEAVDRLVSILISKIPVTLHPRLSEEQLKVFLRLANTVSPYKFLTSIVNTSQLESSDRQPEWMVPALASLHEKFKGDFMDFINDAGKEEYLDQRLSLTPVEKLAVVVLQRVRHLQ